MGQPKFVQYEEERWAVTGIEKVDDAEWYGLKRGTLAIVAPINECVPDDKPRVRKFKHDGYVMEFEPATGIVQLREAGRRKRVTTSLGAIFSAITKAAVRLEIDRRKAKKGKVKRGML